MKSEKSIVKTKINQTRKQTNNQKRLTLREKFKFHKHLFTICKKFCLSSNLYIILSVF